MNSLPTILNAVLVAVATVLLAPSPYAQETLTGGETAAVTEQAATGLTLADVEAAIAALEADATLDATGKALLRPKYEDAINALKKAADFATEAARYRDAIKASPEKIAAVRAELESLPSVESVAQVTTTATPQELKLAINSQRADLSELTDRLEKTNAELARLSARPVEISSRLPEIQRELSDVRVELASPALAQAATSPGRLADRMLLQARQSRLLGETEMLNQEQLSQSDREDLVQAKQELLERQVENARATLDALQVLADRHLASKAERLGSLADQMRSNLPEDDEAAQALATEVQALAREFEQIVQNLAENPPHRR